MFFSVIGISFHETKPEQRELYAFSPELLNKAFNNFQQSFDSSALVILSTCNRVEIYSSVLDYVELLRWWCEFCEQQVHELEQICYFKTRMSALRHLTHVCSGIDSLVIGENQILGQVKEAFQYSIKQGRALKDLRQCFEQAFSMSKKVKSRTLLSTSQISIASIAVKEALEQDSVQTKYLVIGAGQTGELILRYLHQHARERTFVINRTNSKATELAQKYGVQAKPFETLASLARQAQVIFCATSSPVPIITIDIFEQEAEPRAPFFNHYLCEKESSSLKNKKIFDLCIPRNCCPKVEFIENINLITVDQLQKVAQRNNRARRAQVALAQDLVEREIEQFLQRIKKRSQGRDIENYLWRCHQIKEKLLKQTLEGVNENNYEKSLHELAHKLVQKITHEPLKNFSQVQRPLISCPFFDEEKHSFLDQEKIHFTLSRSH